MYNIGDTLLSLNPFVHCLLNKYKGILCDFCFNEKNLLKCSNCKFMYYCNSNCQKSDWTIHKSECKQFSKTNKELILDDFIRIFIRILIRIKNGEANFKDEKGLKTFDTLMDHYEDISNDTYRLKNLYSSINVIKTVMSEEFIQDFESKTLISYFGKITINSFTISSYDLSYSIGSGIFLSASTLDHSCEPNCIVIFDGIKLNIKVLKEFQNLNEAFISYLTVTVDKKQRQDSLLKQYYFKCDCIRCKDDYLDSKMIAVNCGFCKNKLTNINYLEEATNVNIEILCQTCNKQNKFHLNEIHELILLANKCSDINLNRDVESLTDKFEKIFNLNDKNNIENIYLIKIYEVLIDLNVKNGNFKNAAKISKLLVHPYSIYYPQNHPLVAINYLRLGKILLLYEKANKETREYLKKAYDIIQKIYNPSHQLYIESTQLLQQSYFNE